MTGYTPRQKKRLCPGPLYSLGSMTFQRFPRVRAAAQAHARTRVMPYPAIVQQESEVMHKWLILSAQKNTAN